MPSPVGDIGRRLPGAGVQVARRVLPQGSVSAVVVSGSGIDASGQMEAGVQCFWPVAGSPAAGCRRADTRSVGWVTDGRCPVSQAGKWPCRIAVDRRAGKTERKGGKHRLSSALPEHHPAETEVSDAC